MTIIAAFATNDEVVMVADRRRTQLSSGTHYDDVIKVHRFATDILVGLSGTYHLSSDRSHYIGLCERIINRVPYDVGDSIEDIGMKLSRMIAFSFEADTDHEALGLNFILAGKTKKGVYGLCRVNHYEGFEPITMVAEPGTFAWLLIRPDYDPAAWIEEQRLVMANPDQDKLQELARHIAEQGAALDKYISPEYDMLTLKRQR